MDRPRDVLPTPGRPDEAEERAIEATDECQHRDVVEDAVLDLLEAVVIFVEHAARVIDIEDVVGALGPWHAEQPVEVVAPDRAFRRHGRRAAQLAQLALRACLHRLRQRPPVDLGLELSEIVAVVLAQLAIDCPELLLEIELALILEQRAADIVIDLALESQQLDLAH